ncbi:MAG: phosphatidate cytidylyltransferase [Rhizobiales bacterium]|nr:phosphatidate cytidylyltransferase [Hyphomicrobiales bacterium]
MSNLVVRLISALILAPIVIGIAWLGGWPLFFMTVFLTLCIMHEWFQISHCADNPIIKFAAFAVLMLGLYMVQIGYVALALLLVLAFALSMLLWRIRSANKYWLSAGCLYAAGFGYSLVFLRNQPEMGLFLLIFVVAIVWSTDVFAYFTGRLLKGPKLAPKISPGKTWSGAIGGLVAGILASYLVVLGWYGQEVAGQGTFGVLFWGAALSGFSQLGDLFESWVKRKFGVKDSGKIIPGHGGVMDRVDGLLFALALAFVLMISAVPNFPITIMPQQTIN